MDRHQAERTALIRLSHHLEDDHIEHTKKAALMLDAEFCWLKALNAADRRNRDFVLLALRSAKVPEQLKWGYGGFDQTCSMELKLDREIFLQRLELDGFAGTYAYEKYRVPNVFRNDKEVMIKIVSKNGPALSYASSILKNDRDVVMSAIQNKHPTAPLSIQYASKKLRADRRVARAVLRHGHGIKAFKHLDRKLQGDYKLALLAVKSSSEECNASYEVLSELPQEMLEEADIVYEACMRRGSNLRLVDDLILLEDIEIIKAACQNDGTAFEYCPDGPVREEMLRGSNLKMILENGGGFALKEKGYELWCKETLLIPAVKNGLILPSEFSMRLYEEDNALFRNVLRHSSNPFRQINKLDDSLRRDRDVAIMVLKTNKSSAFDEGTIGWRLSNDVPSRVARLYVWELLSIARRGGVYSGDGPMWNEKAIVLPLCKFNGKYYSYASTHLKSDADVARAAFSGSVSMDVVCCAPKPLLLKHQDIAAMAVKACSGGYGYHNHYFRLFHYFGKELCMTPSILLEWTRNGWPLSRYLGFSRLTDTTAALEAVKHISSSWEFRCLFHLFSKSLCGDNEFMVSAVEANHMILKYASPKLFEDYDFLLGVVISSGKDAFKHMSHRGKEFDYLSNFASQVRERLALADGFLIHFLGAIALDPPEDARAKRRRTCRGPAKRCHLRMLDVCYKDSGSDSSIKRTIAEFAGIALGEELQSLRCALDCMLYWGY